MPAPRPSLGPSAVLAAYFRLLQWLVTALMAVMLVPVTLQIVSRYTGLIPRYIWTEEAARFCFIWIIMLGAMIAVREGSHFEVDVLPAPRSRRVAAAMQLVVYGFMLLFALVFLRYGWAYTTFGYSQTSELTGINLAVIHVAYLVTGLTWVAFLGERIVAAVARMRGGGESPRAEEAGRVGR